MGGAIEQGQVQTSMSEARQRLALPRQILSEETPLTYTFLECAGELLPDQVSPAEFIAICDRAIHLTLFERSTGLKIDVLRMFGPMTRDRLGFFASKFVSDEFGTQVEEEFQRMNQAR